MSVSAADKRRLLEELRSRQADAFVVRASAILLVVNGIENALEFIRKVRP